MSIAGSYTTADHLEFEEFTRLLDNLHRDGEYLWELFCALSFCSALPASQVLSMRWTDIGYGDFIDLHNAPGSYPFLQEINRDFRTRVDVIYNLLGRPPLQSFALRNPNTGKPYTLRHINATLKKLKQRYDIRIDNFTTHTFRKTLGIYALKKSGEPRLANILLNQYSIRQTLQYLNMDPDKLTAPCRIR